MPDWGYTVCCAAFVLKGCWEMRGGEGGEGVVK